MQFKLNNRLDVKDVKDNWLEAHIVQFLNNGRKIKVHFKGFTPKWDEIIDLDTESYKISEVGSFSKGHGWARYD